MITRRDLLAAPLVLMAMRLNAAPVSGPLLPQRCLDLRNRGIYLRVLFNGTDVTGRCYACDDTAGTIGLFLHRKGKPYIDERGQVQRETLRGSVVYQRVSRTEWKRLVAADNAR